MSVSVSLLFQETSKTELIQYMHKIENGNRECVKETTTRLEQKKAESLQYVLNTAKNSPTGCGPQLAPKQRCVLLKRKSVYI